MPKVTSKTRLPGKRKPIIPDQTNNLNHAIVQLQSGRTIYDRAKNDFSMLFPEKDSWRQRFKFTMLDWAEKDDSLDIYQFFQYYGLPRQTFYDWCNKYPDIKATAEEVKLTIGCRKRVGALTRKYDKDVAYKDMFKYDPEWKDVDLYNREMKADSETGQHITINLPPVKSSNEVPLLQKTTIEEIKD
jgi:hypothetical protein